MRTDRIYLSPPNVGDEEKEMLLNVIDDGWISSVGPSIDIFEKNLERIHSSRRVLAVNSGTSALHLSLILSGIEKGDGVVVSTFTFAASVNVILYQGAIPVFIDSESDTWNLDPDLLKNYLETTASRPKALILTHLYGVPAQIKVIKQICEEYNIILIEDAAEAVGSKYDHASLGSFGDYGILSFNGNKIITTSGGGALIADEKGYNDGLYLATQANSGKFDYYHEQVGYNYRMSNVLAGIGVVQLGKLDEFVSKKRWIFNYYKQCLSEWFEFPEEMNNTFCNRWLTTPVSKEKRDISALISYLDKHHIESRRFWRPMHMQPVFEHFECVRNGISDKLFERGICLPSGTELTKDDIEYVVENIKSFLT